MEPDRYQTLLLGPEPQAEKFLETAQSCMPELEVERKPDGGWVATWKELRKAGLFRKQEWGIRFIYEEQLAEKAWPNLRDTWTDIFSNAELHPERAANARELLKRTKFLVVAEIIPAPDHGDPRVKMLQSVTESMDMVMCQNANLGDKLFRLLLTYQGEMDPNARFPAWAYDGDPDEEAAAVFGSMEESSATHPDLERVRKRFACLTLLGHRAGLALGISEANPQALSEIHAAVEGLGLNEELEPDEAAFLNEPLGSIDRHSASQYFWRSEGAMVLAWALNLVEEMPPYDVQTSNALPRAIILKFPDVASMKTVLEKAHLRDTPELGAVLEQYLVFHWRMRDFSIAQEARDVRNFNTYSWFGPTDLSWGRFGPKGDLLLFEDPVHAAIPDLVATATSIALERHQAINWLFSYAEIYSDTPTPT